MAEANDRWWHRLGYEAGYQDGRESVLTELEADWIERRRTESLQPTGETGLDGLPIYVLRLGAPNVNSPTFAELQRRRAEPVTPVRCSGQRSYGPCRELVSVPVGESLVGQLCDPCRAKEVA
jgi:hypothetical protein